MTQNTGELIVDFAKWVNGNKDSYTYIYAPTTTQTLKITYKIENKTGQDILEDDESNRETVGNAIEFTGQEKLFDFIKDSPLDKARVLIDMNKNKLKDAEKHNMVAFKSFMLHLWHIESGSTIGEDALKYAKVDLKNILGTKNELFKFINTATDYATIAYVVDRMKQIFAMENAYEGAKISDLRNARPEKWYHEECKSPSSEPLPSSLTREDLLPTSGRDERFDIDNAKINPNLIWYTAFYRDREHPAYSMTAPGSTTVYGKFISEALSGEQLDDGKTWFLKNLDAQTYEKQLLLDSIKSHIDKQFRDQITTDNLLSFLNDGKIDVTIDSSKEKYRIELGASYHFYLLGECANESLGMQIDKVTIKQYKKTITPDEWIYGSREIVQEYNHEVWAAVNMGETSSLADRAQRDARGIGIGLNSVKPKEEIKTIPPEAQSGWSSNPVIGGWWNSNPLIGKHGIGGTTNVSGGAGIWG